MVYLSLFSYGTGLFRTETEIKQKLEKPNIFICYIMRQLQ